MSRRHNVVIDPDLSWVPTMRRALERGHLITALCSPRFARAYPEALALAHRKVSLNTSSLSELTQSLREVTRRHQIDAVIVHRDAILAKVAVACEANGITFTSSRSVITALSKVKTRRSLQAQRLCAIRFQATRTEAGIETAAKAVGFPCVLKPAAGHGSLLTFRIENLRQLRAARRRIRSWADGVAPGDRWLTSQGFVCEEWVDGPIISVEMAVRSGVARPFAVALGTTFAENPCAGYGNIIPFRSDSIVVRTCVEYAKRVCRALSFDLGICDLEMIWTSDGPVLLEANPRKMGGEMPLALELATGLNFNDIVLDTYANRPPNLKVKDARKVTVIRKVMPLHGGRVRAAPRLGWLQSFRPDRGTARFCNDLLRHGVRVRPHQVLGRVLIVSEDIELGFREADRAIRQLERETGLELVRGMLPRGMSIHS